MKFICAGQPKTGTKSIAKALRTLGFKVLDYDEQILYHGKEWLDLFEHDKPLDFYSMYKDCDAVTDSPCNYFYEELMEAFPDAKVILSVRDDEDGWAKSYWNQIEVVHKSYLTKYFWFLPTHSMLTRILLYARIASLGSFRFCPSPYIYRKRYREHNDRVKSVVPKEKLLVYNIKQGWKPLCEFTGKEIPNEPFPHLNVKGSIRNTFQTETELGRKVVREVRIMVGCSIVMAVLLGILLFHLLT